ncbi:MAG: hypothetical protein R3B81_12115 [bacterium]
MSTPTTPFDSPRVRNVLLAMGVLAAFAASSAQATSLCFTNAPQQAFTLPLYDGYESAWAGFDEAGSGCDYLACGPGDQAFRWTISRSDADPNDVAGPVVGPVFYLYLWLECTSLPPDETPLAAVLHVEPSSDIELLGFATMPGAANIGTSTDLELALGVEQIPVDVPFLVGTWPVFRPDPVSVDSESWGRIKATYR